MKFFTFRLSYIVGLFSVAIARDKIGKEKATFNIYNKTNTDSNGNLRVLVKVKNLMGRKTAQNMAIEVRNDLNDGSGIMGLTVTVEQEEALRNDPNIENIGIDHNKFPFYEEPMDAEKHLRQLLEDTPWGIKKVLQDDLSFFDNLGSPSQPYKVCVADTGYALGHEDLPQGSDVTGRDNYGESWTQDVFGHGTHCAGTVAALGNNNIGVTSVIPNNKGDKFQLVITKALGNDGSGTISGLMVAINQCVEMGAKVISMSLGCADCYDQIEYDFMKEKESQGILLVAAAGNNGDSSYGYPASYGSVMSVGSMTELETRSDFSQFNDQIEISAPGSGIRSTIPGNKYSSYDGTSMATPHVAAVAGLIWSYFPSCQAYQIRNVLDKTAKDLGTQGCDTNFGYGLVQAKEAYNLLSNNCGGNLGVTTGLGGCSQLLNNPPPTPTQAPINPPSSPINPPPTPNPTPTPPTNPPPTPTNCAEVTVTITTDDYPEETSFQVLNSNGVVVMSGSGYTGKRTEYITNGCLSYGSYQLTIMDSFGDGMCCTHGDGSYELKVNGSVQKSGGQFTNNESTTFSTSPATPTNPPSSGNCMNVIVTIKTDYYPEETSFKVINQNGVEFMSGNGYTTQLYDYTAASCLPNSNVYQFTIYDTAGDGVCCEFGGGAYNLYVNAALIKSGGVFTTSETTTFPSNAPVPVPTNSPVSGPNILVDVMIKTDTYPQETSFKVMSQNGVEFMSGGGYTAQLTEYSSSKSLPNSNIYQFTIYDTADDGICCGYGEGRYELKVDGAVIKSGGVFTNSETTTFPSNAPVPVPTNPPVPGPSIEVYILILTDTYPEETSFKIIDQNGIEFMTGGGYTEQLTEYTASKSLPSANVYQFTIYDTAEDGMCCGYGQGGYNVFVNGVVIKVGGVFTSSETTTFPTSSYGTPKDYKKPKFMKLKYEKSKVDNSNNIVKDINKFMKLKHEKSKVDNSNDIVKDNKKEGK